MTDIDQLLDQAAEHLGDELTAGEPLAAATTRLLRAQHAIARAQLATLRERSPAAADTRIHVDGQVNRRFAEALRGAVQGGRPFTAGAIAVSIDGGEPLPCDLQVDVDAIDVTVGASLPEPDPAWEVRDAAGHFHAWAKDRTLPTLRLEAAYPDCEPGCDHDNDLCAGPTGRTYRCRLCSEVVVPGTTGWRETGWREFQPGAKTFTMRVHGEPFTIDGEVSIVVTSGQRRLFGTGWMNGPNTLTSHNLAERLAS